MNLVLALAYIGCIAVAIGLGYYYGNRDGLQSGYSNGWSDAMTEVRRIIARMKS